MTDDKTAAMPDAFRSDEPIGDRARRCADGLRDLSRLPAGLDHLGTGEDGLEALSLMGAQAVARLRTGSSRRIVCIPTAGAVTIQARGRPSSGLSLKITQTEVALSHHGLEMKILLKSRPDLASEIMSVGSSIELAHMVARPSFDRAPYRHAAVVLIDAVCDAFATITEALMDGPARTAADDAIAGTRHAMDVCAAMIDAVRPDHLHLITADMVRRTMTAHVGLQPDDDEADVETVAIDVPMPPTLRAHIPGHDVITAFATVETTQPGSGKKPGLKELHVDFLPGLDPDETMTLHDPTTVASLLREYGDDGSSLAAAIDAALAKGTR